MATSLGERGQTSTEYMLLIALGLAIVIVSVAVANQIKAMTDSLLLRTELERNSTIAMLVK
jgi:Flp pilus assembly pilin Flp